MKSLFTIHAGEYLVGSFVERNFPNLRVWLPSRDTGIDLLVTDRKFRRAVSLQVKFSKDFRKPMLRASGWWTFKSEGLKNSEADYWVLVLLGFQQRNADYVVIPPKELLKRLNRIHKDRPALIQSYFSVTARNRCFETRGLSEAEILALAAGASRKERDFSQYLQSGPRAWDCLRSLRNRRA